MVSATAGIGPAGVMVALALVLVVWPARWRLAAVPRPARVNAGRRLRAAWWRAGRRRRRLLAGGVLCAVSSTVLAARLVPWQLAIAALLAASTTVHLVRRARASARAGRNLAAHAAALRAVVRELKSGVGPVEAANHARVDAALPGAMPSQVRQAWTVSATYGIPLATVLKSCIDDLDDRAALARLRAQHVAGPAVSGYVLAGLPLAGIAMGAGLGSRPIDVLLGGALGGALLVGGVALCCAGLIWTSRIARGGGDD